MTVHSVHLRRPNDDQMEYLVSKFEEMAQFLSAPEAQSRQPDDYLFSELEMSSGLGFITGDGTLVEDDKKARDVHVALDYILEVGKYIESVTKHTKDLKMRFDETKQLNSIQTELITDLRQLLRNYPRQVETHKKKLEEDLGTDKDESGTARRQGKMKAVVVQRTSFWSAIGEALDTVGDMWLEW